MLVAVLAGLVYANSLDGALLYDDSNAIVRNAAVREGGVVEIFTTPSWWRAGHGRGWRPVTTATFALNHVLHGLAPWGYHLVNALLHVAVSVLVLVTFATVTGAPLTALVAALLFATHPVHTEAVASVVGRAELLAAAAFFLAWLCFLRGDRARRWRYDGAGVAVFFTGLLAKENVATLLPVLVLVDVLLPAPGASATVTLRRHAGRYAALVAAVVVYVLLRGFVIGADPPGIQHLDNPLIALPLGARLLTAVKVVGLYGWRLVVPLQLAADYSFDQITAVTSPLDGRFLAGLAVLVAVPVLGWWTRVRAPHVALGLGFLALTFALVANLAFPIGTIMAERLLYLPSAGFCLLAAATLVALAGVDPAATTTRRVRPLLWVPVLVVVAAYGVRTWVRNPVWHDPEIFFTTMVAEAPRSARSHRELAGMLVDRGRYDLALRAFERSLLIKPGDAATLYNLGNALVQAGDLERAAAAYEEAIVANPKFVDAMMNLSTAEGRRGRYAVAIEWLERALVQQPENGGLHMNLANTLFQAGRPDEARAAYEVALAREPDGEQVLTNYGTFLYAQGDYERAIVIAGRAADRNSRAAVSAVASYAARGRIDEARAALARAERRFPGDPAVADLARRLGGASANGAAAP
jgi:tetratricopeptide (TPR) repeat protein